MNQQSITLIEPTLELEPEFISMAEEFRAAGDDRYQSARDNFSAYIHGLLDAARRINLPPDFVPSSEFWLVSGRHIIEKNGGRLQGQAISTKSGKLISRYWIELP